MNNLIKVIQLLYKKLPASRVISKDILYDGFSKDEFLQLYGTYLEYYSEDDAVNFYNYYIDAVREYARFKGRLISSKFNVFEILFYCSNMLLRIRNNTILCRYTMLHNWRRLSVELSEDLLISAYLAGELMPDEARGEVFCWPRVIGHDNQQLNAIVERKISENHFHLNGSGPIFQISWLSLMNNINNSQFGKLLLRYDAQRRYRPAAYSSSFREASYSHMYLQAALIRLVLYTRLTNQRISIGSYEITTDALCRRIEFPVFTHPEYANEPHLAKQDVNMFVFVYKEGTVRFRDIIVYLCRCLVNSADGLHELWHQNRLLYELTHGSVGDWTLSTARVKNVLKESINLPYSHVFYCLFMLIEKVSLRDIERLFTDRKEYNALWQKRTLDNVQYMLNNPTFIETETNSLQSLIDALRISYPKDDVPKVMMDYILTTDVLMECGNTSPNLAYAGERWFMYKMFREIYLQNEDMDGYFQLFYAYLLIKERIRSELIQSNKNVGFLNFHRYQARKGDLLADSIYRDVFVKGAVSETLLTPNIRSLELRITPKSDAKKMCDQINYVDNLIDPQGKQRDRFFYTIHFIKSIDENPDKDTLVHCRHYKKRRDIEKKAFVLADIREKNSEVGKRILGIDAAANEIGCRPEVFAPMFRYLKNHRFINNGFIARYQLPQLGITYHVGEDFLDLADGLRAIDEAVHFFNMSSGDRLGHALALGIDVPEWYESKEYSLSLPIHDHMDNLAWIYHKLIQYNIQGFESLKQNIHREFSGYFEQIYKANINWTEVNWILDYLYRASGSGARVGERGYREYSLERHWKGELIFNKAVDSGYSDKRLDLDIYNYYNAWMLRGDDPEFYSAGFFDKGRFDNDIKKYRINEHFPPDRNLRYLPDVALLYYLYHYNKQIRIHGRHTIKVNVTKAYAQAVAAIQKAMQKELAAMGLAIETNPSSNYLIGTFRRYDKHPIIKFYNKGLTHNPDLLDECPQFSVSINTDDQGVFSTSLENEYALMAAALESVTDENDRRVYSSSDIYEWLDNIRIFGNEQSFGKYRVNHLDNRH